MVKTRKEVQKINKENKDHKVKLKLQGKVKEFKKGMEPKAVIPEPGEVAAIMKEKKLASIQERLQRQRNFRFTVRDMILRRHELIEMADEISGISKLRILWEGVPCPQNILIAQHNLKKETYKNLQQAAKYLQQALKNDGLSDSDINSVIDGKYVKDDRKIEKMAY